MMEVKSVLLKGLTESYKSVMREVLKEVITHYKLDEEEVYKMLEKYELKEEEKKEKKEKKEKREKREKEEKKKPLLPLPYDGVLREENCYGLEMNGGLMTQCWSSKLEGDVYCKRCRTQASKNESGKPSVGDIRDRMQVEALKYKHPKTGRQVLPYINVMKKKNITLEEAEMEAEKYGVKIEAEQLEEREQKRGRPAGKKEGEKEGEKKKQGRKRVEKVIVSACVEDDLIAALKKAQEEGQVVAVVQEPIEQEPIVQQVETEVKEVKKRGRKPMSEEEKKVKAEERKLAKKSKAEQEAKAKMEAEEKAKMEAEEKAKMEAEAKAKMEAEEKAKMEAEAKANAELEAESGIESGVEEESCGGSDEEEESEQIKVKRFEHEGVTYLITSENMLYDVKTHEQVGMWNEEKGVIEEIDEEDESDGEEEEE